MSTKPWIAVTVTVVAGLLAGCSSRTSDLPPPKDSDAVPTLSGGKSADVSHLGGLVLESSPPGIAVKVNGKKVGVTPLTVEDLEPGTYEVTFEDPRDGDTTHMVDVAEGEYVTVPHTTAPTSADAKFPGK